MPGLLKKIIGKTWRALPVIVRQKAVRWTQEKFTVSVGGVVFNQRGEVLLLDHVLRPASGWGIPGGFMGAGEQPAETLEREIFEETGLRAADLKMIRVKTNYRHVEILFRARAASEPRVLSSEIHSARWFALEEMPAAMSDAQKRLIRQIAAAEKTAD